QDVLQSRQGHPRTGPAANESEASADRCRRMVSRQWICQEIGANDGTRIEHGRETDRAWSVFHPCASVAKTNLMRLSGKQSGLLLLLALLVPAAGAFWYLRGRNSPPIAA